MFEGQISLKGLKSDGCEFFNICQSGFPVGEQVWQRLKMKR